MKMEITERKISFIDKLKWRYGFSSIVKAVDINSTFANFLLKDQNFKNKYKQNKRMIDDILKETSKKVQN